MDPSRIAASVVSGIGFLAGGAIVRTGLTVQGTTTAAGLWLVTAIGLCSGAGMYVEGVSVTAIGLVVLTVLRRFEHKDDHRVRRRVVLVLEEGAPEVSELVGVLSGLGASAAAVEYERRLDEKGVTVVFDVRLPIRVSLTTLIERLQSKSGVRRIHVQAPG